MDTWVRDQIVIHTMKIQQGNVLERGGEESRRLPGGAVGPCFKWQEGCCKDWNRDHSRCRGPEVATA